MDGSKFQELASSRCVDFSCYRHRSGRMHSRRWANLVECGNNSNVPFCLDSNRCVWRNVFCTQIRQGVQRPASRVFAFWNVCLGYGIASNPLFGWVGPYVSSRATQQFYRLHNRHSVRDTYLDISSFAFEVVTLELVILRIVQRCNLRNPENLERNCKNFTQVLP